MKVESLSTVFNDIQFYVCEDEQGRKVIKSEKELSAIEAEIEAEKEAIRLAEEEEAKKKSKPNRFGGKGGK